MREARGSPPIRRPASGAGDRCARRGARRGAWTVSTGVTGSRPHPNRLPPALAGDIRRVRGHSLLAGDVLRARGHFLPAGGILRVGGRDCCPRRRRMPPPGKERTRPRGMSPWVVRCGDVRVLRPWPGTSCVPGDTFVGPGASCALGDGIAVPEGVECPRPGKERTRPRGMSPWVVRCPDRWRLTSAPRWGGCRGGRARAAWRGRRLARRPPRSSGRRRSRRGSGRARGGAR